MCLCWECGTDKKFPVTMEIALKGLFVVYFMAMMLLASPAGALRLVLSLLPTSACLLEDVFPFQLFHPANHDPGFN